MSYPFEGAIPVAARSKARARDLSLAGIAGSYPDSGMVVACEYSGPLTYELNSFPRAGRNSSWS
jgi:hypothetical protein